MDEALKFPSATGDWVGFEERTRGNVFREWQQVVVGIGMEWDGRLNHRLDNSILVRSDAKSNIVCRTEIGAVHR